MMEEVAAQQTAADGGTAGRGQRAQGTELPRQDDARGSGRGGVRHWLAGVAGRQRESRAHRFHPPGSVLHDGERVRVQFAR